MALEVILHCSVSNRHGCVEGNNDSYRSSVLAHPDEEVNIESHHQSNTGSHPSNMIHTKVTSEYGGSAIADSNGNVRSIIRNIVRDWAVEAMLLFIYSDRLPDIYDVMGSTPMCSYTVMVHCSAASIIGCC
ncbi:BTB/POZ/MATH-domains containing protein [Trifolium repens]|nr:BTB/POZ/MATH-domains containing protein [Trifolium repens]